MKIILLTLLVFVYPFQKHQLNADYATYCNARFNYCISYPSFLFPQPESENGDGRLFTNAANTSVLTVFGRLNQDADGNAVPFKKQYAIDVKSFTASESKIMYQKAGSNFYVISGERNGKIFYQKMMIKGDACCYAILEYNKEERKAYDSVLAQIFKSFK
jgi:hypothetical protein